MFGRRKSETALVPSGPVAISSVDDAMASFRLASLDISLSKGDLELIEKFGDDGKFHTRRDYIIHPRSAVRRTDDGRFSVDAARSERLDDLQNLYFNNRWSKYFFGEGAVVRYITEDGWELFTLGGREMVEVQTAPYGEELCDTCHETMPNYDDAPRKGERRPGINRYNHPLSVRETRSFRLKPLFLEILDGAGMAVTSIEHPCYHSLQDLLRPEHGASVDPPRLGLVFPEHLSY